MEPSPSLPPDTGKAPPDGGSEPARSDVPAAGAELSSLAPEGSAPAETPGPAPVPPPPRRIGPLPLNRRTGMVAGAVAGLFLTLAWAGTGYHYDPYVDTTPVFSGRPPRDQRAVTQSRARLRERQRQLTARLKAAAPRGTFIVIDQTHNRLYLKRDEETLLEAVCSAGSGMVLKETSGKKRQWVFDTPRGAFEVLSRAADPVWHKPDWAFVEEGQPIPKNPAERYDYGSLGEYALYFGNGYMIHGTLYERLLGRAVSHGCIRVGRDDLRKVWAAAKLGTRIYIY